MAQGFKEDQHINVVVDIGVKTEYIILKFVEPKMSRRVQNKYICCSIKFHSGINKLITVRKKHNDKFYTDIFIDRQ